MHRFRILLLLSVSALYAGTGFFAERWVPRSTPHLLNTQIQEAPSTQPDVSFSVSFLDPVAKVLPTVFGNNINPWLGEALLTDNNYGLEHLRQAGITNMRIPGGNWSNNWLWDGTAHWNFKDHYLDSVSGAPNKTWPLLTEDLYSLANSSNAELQICVNFSLSRFIDSPKALELAAHYAANWVRKVNDTLGLNVRYWEVGNENYGPWQTGWIVNGDTLDGDEYGIGFGVFADSMKAADPTIKVGAVALERDNGNNSGGYRWWMKKMLPLIQDKADYLVYHEYFTWAPDINTVTTNEVLEGLSLIKNAKDSIEAMVARYTNKPKNHFPIAFTEYNVRAGTKTNQFVSAVFLAMALGEFVRHDIGLANLWGVVDGYDAVEGDMGMLSRKEPFLKDYTPHPSFYVFMLYDKMFGDELITSAPEEQNGVRLYASKFSSGELSIVLINKTNTARTISLQLQDFINDGYAYGYSLQAASPTAAKLSLNGQVGTNYGPLNYASIPAWKQVVSNNPQFSAPAWSVQFILLKSKGGSTAIVNKKKIAPSLSRTRFFDLLGRKH